MKQLDSILVWLGVVGFTAIGLIISFYIASIILPIVLLILLISVLASLGRAFYMRRNAGSPVERVRSCRQSKKPAQIIDAEYEVLDSDSKN